MHHSTISSVPSSSSQTSSSAAVKEPHHQPALQPISEKPVNGVSTDEAPHLTNGTTATSINSTTHKGITKTQSAQPSVAPPAPSPRDINANNLDVNKENIPLKVSKTTPTNLSSAQTPTSQQTAPALTATDLATSKEAPKASEPVKNVIHFENSLTLSQTSCGGVGKDPMSASQLSNASGSITNGGESKAPKADIESYKTEPHAIVKPSLPQSASSTSTASKASTSGANSTTGTATSSTAAKERPSIFTRGLKKSETVRASEMPKSNSIDKTSLTGAYRQSALPTTSESSAQSYRTKTELLQQNQKSNPLASSVIGDGKSAKYDSLNKTELRPRYVSTFFGIFIFFPSWLK